MNNSKRHYGQVIRWYAAAAFMLILIILVSFVPWIGSTDDTIQRGPPDEASSSLHIFDMYKQAHHSSTTDHNGDLVQHPTEPAGSSTTSNDILIPLQKLKDTKLDVLVTPTPTGYRLTIDAQFNPILQQTLMSKDGERLVQIIRRIGWDEGSEFYRQDVMVTHLETGELQVYPLTLAYITDVYTVDSLARHAQLLDDELVTVSAIGDQPGAESYFQIVKLNIHTGERAVLFDQQPENVQPDFYGAQWITSDGERFVINSHSGGQLWVFDLLLNTSTLWDHTFTNHWPISSIEPSPDGKRFWYSDIEKLEFQLYDLDGNVLATAPFSDGYSSYPPVQWSPDAQYTFYPYTSSQHPDVIIEDQHNMLIIAPQVIELWDRDGGSLQLLRVAEDAHRHLEIVGWLPDQALVMEYELERESGRIQKVNKRFILLELASGRQTALEIEQELERLKAPLLLEQAGSREHLFLLDQEANRIWTNYKAAHAAVSKDGKRVAWIETNDVLNESILYLYPFMNDASLKNKMLDELHEVQILGDWLTHQERPSDPGLLLYYDHVERLFQ